MERDLDGEVIAGSEASYILNHRQFKGAFNKLRDSIYDQMRAVKPRDKEMHTELIRWLQTLDRFEHCLRETIRTGELAGNEIRYKKTFAEQAKAQLDRVFSRN